MWAVPKAGGSPRSVATGSGSRMVAADAYVYWIDNGSIYSAPVEGGQASQIYSGWVFSQLALDSDGALYFVASATGDDRSSAVYRMQNRTLTTLVTGPWGGGISVDDKYAYVGTDGMIGTGELLRVPKSGGTAESMFSCRGCNIISVKADGGYVFFCHLGATVWSIPKNGGTATLLSSGNASYMTGPQARTRRERGSRILGRGRTEQHRLRRRRLLGVARRHAPHRHRHRHRGQIQRCELGRTARRLDRDLLLARRRADAAPQVGTGPRRSAAQCAAAPPSGR